MLRAFPVVYAHDVGTVVAFYERLGFEAVFQHPEEGEAGYVGMRRDEAELGVATYDSPRALAGVEPGGGGPRFELFVYVEDLDAMVAALRQAGDTVLRDPADMPWGERLAFATDPEGNPISLAQST